MATTGPTYPRKLRRGDTVRVVAPSRSRALVLEHDHSQLIEARFADLELRVTFGEHVDERDDFDSASIESRVAGVPADWSAATCAPSTCCKERRTGRRWTARSLPSKTTS